MTFDLIQQGGILLLGKPLPWHHQPQSQLSLDSLSNPATPRFRDGKPSEARVLENQGPTAPPAKQRQHCSFQSTNGLQTSLLQSHRARPPGGLCQALSTSSFPLVPAGPQFLEPPEEGQAGGDKQMDSNRLRQSSFHRQVEGGLSSSSSGRLWGPGAGSGSLQSCPIGYGAGVAA